MDDRRRAWSARIDEATDLAELDRIDSELRATREEWAGPLRFKLGVRRKRVRDKVSAPPRGRSPASEYGLSAATGQRLYGYRLSDDVFHRIGRDLQRCGSPDGLQSGSRPGHFVLWASEWFRRCYKGGGMTWAGLVGALGFPPPGQVEQNVLREVTRRGLALWQRDVIRLSDGRAFLGTLAREGGFPTAAVEDDGGGWARSVLQALVGKLLAEPAATDERALELAQAQRARMPLSFQDEEYMQLCVDLALAIVVLRREAEPMATAQGIPVAVWLALHRPEWRDSLPLTTGEKTAEALLNSLMAVEAITGASVGAIRLLARGDREQGDKWFEAVRIELDGDVDGAIMRRILPSEGRLRAFACGDLARHLPGEIGLFEPPALGEITWSARSTRLVRGICRVPFAASLELELRAGERRVERIAIPGGKPRRGQLLVLELDGAAPGPEPDALRVVGTGSGLYRAQTVYLQVPATWQVIATIDEVAEPLGPGAGERQLWRVTGGAFVIDGDGDRHRIRCGQAGDSTQRIELVGTHCPWAEVRGDVDLFCGPPHARTSRAEGALFLRDLGTRQWRRAPSVLPLGHYELGWRHDDILLDRRRIAVLPQSASLRRSGIGKDVRYELEGFGAIALEPSAQAPVSVGMQGAVWIGTGTGTPQARFDAALTFPGGATLPVVIDYPCAAGIARWDGTIVPHRDTITLDRIREFVAVADGPMELVAQLHEPRQRRCAELSWHFDRELPLASIAQDLASLLMPQTIDAWITLAMHDGVGTPWRLDPFPLRLGKDGGALVTNEGVVAEGAELCGRALADPCFEVSFGSYSLLSEANHRPVRLPDGLEGPWLVYLRAGETILSRPIIAPPGGGDPAPSTALGQAMALEWGKLDPALHAFLEGASKAGAAEPLNDLLVLTSSLGTLPPATLRVFELLPQYPAVLARMAFHAAPDQRDAVLALSDALPFLWCAVPRSCWDAARAEVFERMFALVGALPDPVAIAMQAVRLTEKALVEQVPLLASLFRPASTQPLEDVANSFLNRAFDRIYGASQSRYRGRLADILPGVFEKYDDRVLDTLDAPCAAALAVAGKWRPGADDIRHMKTVARTSPRYFAEAFEAWLKEHS